MIDYHNIRQSTFKLILCKCSFAGFVIVIVENSEVKKSEKMNGIKFQPHRRYASSRRSYSALISVTDPELDIGHFWRRANGAGQIICPFSCKGRAEITNFDRLVGRIRVEPDRECQGAIETYSKYSFAGVAEAGYMNELPDWTQLISKSNREDPTINIIQRVSAVSFRTTYFYPRYRVLPIFSNREKPGIFELVYFFPVL